MKFDYKSKDALLIDDEKNSQNTYENHDKDLSLFDLNHSSSNEDLDKKNTENLKEKGEVVNKNEQTFEEAMHELEKIISTLDKGDLSLNDAINAYQKGVELKKFCHNKLDEAKTVMEEVFRSYDSKE